VPFTITRDLPAVRTALQFLADRLDGIGARGAEELILCTNPLDRGSFFPKRYPISPYSTLIRGPISR
jgi:hypothetical protein